MSRAQTLLKRHAAFLLWIAMVFVHLTGSATLSALQIEALLPGEAVLGASVLELLDTQPPDEDSAPADPEDVEPPAEPDADDGPTDAPGDPQALSGRSARYDRAAAPDTGHGPERLYAYPSRTPGRRLDPTTTPRGPPLS